MTWVFLVLLYGVLKGGREIAKKKAMYTNTVMEVLVAYTVLSFVLVVPQAKDAGGMELKFYFLVALKAFAIFYCMDLQFPLFKVFACKSLRHLVAVTHSFCHIAWRHSASRNIGNIPDFGAYSCKCRASAFKVQA